MAVINPDSWLVRKADGLVSLDDEANDILTIEKEEPVRDNGPRTNQENTG